MTCSAMFDPLLDDDLGDDELGDGDECRPVPEGRMLRARLLTTEDENSRDDAACAVATDFIHDFRFDLRQ